MLGCVVWVVVLVVVVWVVVVVVSRARAVMVAERTNGGGSATADTTPPDGEGERGVMVSLMRKVVAMARLVMVARSIVSREKRTVRVGVWHEVNRKMIAHTAKMA